MSRKIVNDGLMTGRVITAFTVVTVFQLREDLFFPSGLLILKKVIELRLEILSPAVFSYIAGLLSGDILCTRRET